MLVAEIHGKVLAEAQNHEDYLTSAVFGLLRFIKPQFFWQTLLERTKSTDPTHSSLTSVIGHSVSEFSHLQVQFWLRHPVHGQPDLVLTFLGNDLPPLTLVIEVKLSGGKSGERDQLVRYLRLLDEWDRAGATEDHRFLVYLTPRESLDEIEESLQSVQDGASLRPRVFRLRWQDILEVARSTAHTCEEPAKTILSDIAEFLRRRGLQYFSGFGSNIPLEENEPFGRFWKSTCMNQVDMLEWFSVERGGWMS